MLWEYCAENPCPESYPVDLFYSDKSEKDKKEHDFIMFSICQIMKTILENMLMTLEKVIISSVIYGSSIQ